MIRKIMSSYEKEELNMNLAITAQEREKAEEVIVGNHEAIKGCNQYTHLGVKIDWDKRDKNKIRGRILKDREAMKGLNCWQRCPISFFE